jgi:DNA-binding transcriptional LysR family regulator
MADEAWSNLRWDDVRVFLAIERNGTLAGAARALKVDQTTAGRRLAALEEVLGARLFDRTPDGLQLTPAGKGVLPSAEQVEASVIALTRTASGVDARIEGTVRLATSETLVVELLMERFAPRLGRWPDLTLEIVTGAAFVDLSRRQADVALRFRPKGAPPAEENIIAKKVAVMSFFAYASSTYLAEHPVPKAGDFHAHAVLEFEEGLTVASASFLKAAKKARVPLRVGSLLSMASAIRHGTGIGALPAFIGDPDPRLRRVSDGSVDASDAWVLVHPDLRSTARVRVVFDALVETMMEEAALFAGER